MEVQNGSARGGHTLAELVERLQKCYDPDIEAKILNVYVSGSRVYGTANAESDWDYIIVTTQPTSNVFQAGGQQWTPELPFPPSNNLDVYEDTGMNFDVSFITLDHFTILLREHRLSVLECLHLPKQFVLLERHVFTTTLDVDVLRKIISWEASLKFDHAKRRLTEGKEYKAKKLIWLSVRYLIFAIQLLTKIMLIVTEGDAGRVQYMISKPPTHFGIISQAQVPSWDYVEEHFRPIFKAFDSKFRLQRNFNDFYNQDDLQSASWLSIHMHPPINARTLEVKKGRDAVVEPHSLAVVNYLRENGLTKLVSEYTVVACRHKKYSNLVQISPTVFTPMDNIGREVSGILLDEEQDWQVIAHFCGASFYPYGEPLNSFQWGADTGVWEYLDGTLVLLYHYREEWHVASARIPDADEPIGWKSLSGEVPPKQIVRQMFWDVWGSLGYALPSDKSKCYIFTYVAPDNRRIVRYDSARIILHGVRDLTSFIEMDPTPVARENGWECVRSFAELATHEAVSDAVKGLNPWEQAGYLARDAHGNYLKYLSPQYMAFFFSMGWQNKGFGPLNLGGENFDFECLVELHRFGQERDFLFYFPKWAEHMANAGRAYEEFLACFDSYYDQIREVEDQRELARRVKELGLPHKTWPAVVFEMKKEGVRSARELFAFIPRARFIKLWKTFRDLHKQQASASSSS